MAVPKKRTGASAQGKRRANWKATKPEITRCKNCGEPALTHTVCTSCGYYKGKAVSIKSADYVETTATVEEKTAKKTTKKAAKTEETATKKTTAKKTTKKAAEAVEEKVEAVEVTEEAEKTEE